MVTKAAKLGAVGHLKHQVGQDRTSFRGCHGLGSPFHLIVAEAERFPGWGQRWLWSTRWTEFALTPSQQLGCDMLRTGADALALGRVSFPSRLGPSPLPAAGRPRLKAWKQVPACGHLRWENLPGGVLPGGEVIKPKCISAEIWGWRK